MTRGVAGTWNGRHGYSHDRRARKREEGLCFDCQKVPRGATIRCEPCRKKHNLEANKARAAKRKRELE